MTPLLELSAVTKRFGGVVAVSELDLSLYAGTVHGLIGPNGAGKSTTLSLITGITRPDDGDVRLDGRSIVGRSPVAIAKAGIGRTFQQATPLVGMTVLENVMTGTALRYRTGVVQALFRTPAMRREEHDARTVSLELLERYGLADRADRDASELPFGELRVLEVARAAAMRPQVLLLDEPAAGLNRAESNRLGELVQQLREDGVGVLIVDHDVPFMLSICDELTVMDYGRRIAHGDPHTVARDPEVRKAYLGSSQSAPDPAGASSGRSTP